MAALGVGLLATLAFAWIAIGGVHHGTRAALHLALAGGLGLAAGLTDRSLAHAGRMLPLARAAAVLLAACAVGLLPVPRAVRAWVAPAHLEARPETGWWTLSLDPEATVGELCDLLLPLGVLVWAGTWGAAWWRRSGIERAARIALVAVAGLAAAHALAGATALLGVVPTSLRPGQTYFAPFVDPNHTGTAVAMLLPAAVAAALDPRRTRHSRGAWAGAAALALGVVVAIRSSGALLAAAVSGVVAVWRAGGPVAGRVAPVAAAGVTLLAAPWLWLADSGAGATFPARVATWRSTVAAIPGFWLAGSGGGTFERAIQPRIDGFVLWGHAHHDLLEWLLEHGLVGLVALGVAAVGAVRPVLRAGDARWAARGDVLAAGVAAVGVHGLVDFPLQIPALAMGAAALWALRCTAFAGRREADPAVVRRILAVGCALQLAAAGWEARTAAVTRAAAEVWASGPSAGGRTTLARLAPWRPEGPLLDAWRALQRGEAETAAALARGVAARHPDDPRALRGAARVLARTGATDEARTVYERAIARFPGDWRTRVARALDAPAERRADAWRDAFAHGAPARWLEPAWAAVPVGLVWVEAASGRDAAFSERLGAFLAPLDPEAAALAYEQARLLDPSRYPAGYARVLVELGRLDEAGAYLAAATAARPGDVRLERQEAELLEALGRWGEAAEVWLGIGARLDGAVARGLRAMERHHGPEAALRTAERLSRAGPLDGPAVLEVARLERDTGDFAGCTTAIDAAGLRASERFGRRARALHDSCLRAERGGR